uniref:Uncharacterized protein n=1 Tax=Glossina morsitans morsitans TaxID=37546 RepID=A0A1B0FRG4_GLOMM
MIPSQKILITTISRKRTPLVSSNQGKTWISKNYHWDEDDNDFFAFINTQEISDQNVKVNNNFPSISKFPVNKQITQDNLQETAYETKLKDIKARISNLTLEKPQTAVRK